MKKGWMSILLSMVLVSSMALTGCGTNTAAPESSTASNEAGSSDAAAPLESKADESAAAKSDYPKKQISLIIQANPGGLSDTTARSVAQIAQEALGVPIVCSNKPGASGAVAMSFLQASSPDGYTIGYVPVELAMVQSLGFASDVTPEAFDLICASNISNATITVRTDSGWNSVDDLVKYAKEHPGELKMGNSGTGSIWQVAGDSFAKAAEIDVNQVPFDGAAPAVAALLGKHIQVAPVSEMEVTSGVASGELKVLAVMSGERSPFYPDVPTLKELGYEVDISAWGGFAAPKGTPPEVLEVLYKAFGDAVASEKFKELTTSKNYSPLLMDHTEFTAFANEQYETYKAYFAENSVKK